MLGVPDPQMAFCHALRHVNNFDVARKHGRFTAVGSLAYFSFCNLSYLKNPVSGLRPKSLDCPWGPAHPRKNRLPAPLFVRRHDRCLCTSSLAVSLGVSAVEQGDVVGRQFAACT